MKCNEIHRSDIDNIILLSDVHLGVRNASIEWIENIKDYFNRFFIPYIKTIVDKEADGYKAVLVIAGDFFDHRQCIDINVMNVGADIMQQVSSIIETFMVIGNHDIYKKEDIDVNSLRLFQYFSNITVIDKLSVLHVKNDVRFALIPWIGFHDKETEVLKNLKTSTDYAIMHADISGMVYDNGRAILNGADTKVYGKKIYSGHIHKRQESKNVTYIGSPYQLRRSDIGNVKGVYTLNITDTGKVEETFTKNNVSPIFKKVRFDDLVDRPFEEIRSIIYNNYIYIVINRITSTKEKSKLADMLDVFDKCDAKRLEFLVDTTSVDDTAQEEVSKDLTINDIFVQRVQSISELEAEEKDALIEMNNIYMKHASDELSDLEIAL